MKGDKGGVDRLLLESLFFHMKVNIYVRISFFAGAEGHYAPAVSLPFFSRTKNEAFAKVLFLIKMK
jgi:hypothetical protein